MAELAPDHASAHKLALCRSGHATVMLGPYTAWQVKPMRFSSLFQHTLPQADAGREEPVRETPQPLAAPGQDLPDDLDARVRLVGEWQLGEG